MRTHCTWRYPQHSTAARQYRHQSAARASAKKQPAHRAEEHPHHADALQALQPAHQHHPNGACQQVPEQAARSAAEDRRGRRARVDEHIIRVCLPSQLLQTSADCSPAAAAWSSRQLQQALALQQPIGPGASVPSPPGSLPEVQQRLLAGNPEHEAQEQHQHRVHGRGLQQAAVAWVSRANRRPVAGGGGSGGAGRCWAHPASPGPAGPLRGVGRACCSTCWQSQLPTPLAAPAPKGNRPRAASQVPHTPFVM